MPKPSSAQPRPATWWSTHFLVKLASLPCPFFCGEQCCDDVITVKTSPRMNVAERVQQQRSSVTSVITRPFGSTMENRQFFLLEFKRSPEAYRLCLANEPTLAACRRCLYAAGYNTQLDTRAKVFLHPDHWPSVLDYLAKGVHSLRRPNDLQFRHVITDEEHCKALLSALAALPRSENINVKEQASFCVDVPCKPACESLQPELPWETMPQLPKAWMILECDFQPGSPAEIQWCDL